MRDLSLWCMDAPVVESRLSYSKTYGILVPRPGIEPVCPAVEVWNPTHWTIKEVLKVDSYWKVDQVS